MIIQSTVITDLHINSVDDLYKLKPLVQDGILEVKNKQIGTELGIDRRTVDKYINGFKKSKTRNCDNCLSSYLTLLKICWIQTILEFSVLYFVC